MQRVGMLSGAVMVWGWERASRGVMGSGAGWKSQLRAGVVDR